MHHDLKTWPNYFEAVLSGDKPFEIRYNGDRGFQKGDTVTLKEYDPHGGVIESLRYTGRETTWLVTYVTDYEQKPGFVVFGLGAI